MIRQSDPKNARIISIVAATTIALACGTNYVYSGWGPQFAQRLKLNSTQANLIGTAGNLGMYACGIPSGMLVDRRSPRWGVAIGAILLGGGYYPLAQAYKAGPGSFSVFVLCLFAIFTGAGSASAFTAAIKVAALNYPQNRGTATAFPLAAFGLSAFFFSTISAFALRDDTYIFLMLLATGTFVLPVLAFFFLRVLPPTSYQQIPSTERLHRTSHSSTRPTMQDDEPGAPKHPSKYLSSDQAPEDDESNHAPNGDESSSLISKSSNSDLETSKHQQSNEPPYLDIRGCALLPLAQFWQLFAMLGLLTGIGLMTINNIGNDARALWYHLDPTTPDAFITKRQSMHVSILSFCSFTGRLISGIGSDLLVSRLGRSRYWCLMASAVTFSVTQVLGASIASPHTLFLVSSLTGLAYGILFGVYPSLIAHAFGVHGLSQNWGTMTLAPVIFGNIFNILYGRIYDSHSQSSGRDMVCSLGVDCYATAYWITFGSAVAGVALVGWSIWHENRERLKSLGREHEREA